MNKKEPFIKIQKLKKYFHRESYTFKAIDGISFDIYAGETIGLVGESGSGKTTVGRMMIRLEKPTEGQIFFEGEDVHQMSSAKMKTVYRKMQMMFQHSMSVFNPRMNVEQILSEPMNIQRLFLGSERRKRVEELLQLVGLDVSLLSRFPHELSGGQKQRVNIARTIAIEPTLLICDEPVSALDVSIQRQIIHLLQDLQKKLGLTYLFISHDIELVAYLSNRILVLYHGTIVEMGASKDLYERPLHPYTQALVFASSANSSVQYAATDRKSYETESDERVDSGCVFHNRCPQATNICMHVKPNFHSVEGDRLVACHMFSKEQVV